MNRNTTQGKSFNIKPLVFKVKGTNYASQKTSFTSLSPTSKIGSPRFADNLRKPLNPILSPKINNKPYDNTHIFRSTRFHSEFKKPTLEKQTENVTLKFSIMKELHLQKQHTHHSVHCSTQVVKKDNINLFVLCEGHGKFGKECSQYVNQKMIEKLTNNNLNNVVQKKIDQINLLFEDLFSEINKEMQYCQDLDSSQSGSQALCILISEMKLICSNLGESKVMYFFLQKNNLVFKQLNTVHSIEKMSEQQRILNHGGEIEQEYINYVKSGPLKIWLKQNKSQGIQLTRCIGYNHWQQIGITCQPDTSEQVLTQQGYIIIGNSQLFDLIDTIDISKVLEKHMVPQSQQEVSNICEQLLHLAKSRISSNLHIEQILMIILFIGI
ncbi:unnamed protein product (macronuclear) [Paramecium tetraurelia]|uniref:protein-serine/threonine phosphatase n=1 Tax=Paramecium tetraurelia TaxID=5888 RepID=A0CY52_PARTE|nr:uncharacterized protein GSPATT00011351001 [Paramecium tetraurelia]CAK75719.1 unnamed protein product [Paramecium tetraurelia]|eukprot:XP_001443116.1 hypothetical protein (macronuclear) [Paramecium tetraurelia strain d4-2]